MKKSTILSFALCATILFTIQNSNGMNSNSCSKKFSEFYHDTKEWIQDSWEILKRFSQNPRTISAVTASTPWLAKELVKNIETDNEKDRKILEIGFGTGIITKYILKSKNQNDQLDAIELEPSLYEFSKNKFPTEKYPQLTLYNKAFQDWYPENFQSSKDKNLAGYYDIIITTLPFSRLPHNLVQQILKQILFLLKLNGKFSYIALIGSETWGYMTFNSDEREFHKKKVKSLKTWKKENFNNEEEEKVFWNIPPSFVYHLKKNDQ